MINKIHIFKDKDDYINDLTDDNIINITGEVGSSIKLFGHSQRNNKKYLVINIDNIISNNNLNSDEKNISKIKYKDISELYSEIVKYIKSKNKYGIIEGYQLINVKKISVLKGKIIVKRESVYNCYLNSVKSDIKNKFNAFISIINRISIIKTYKDVEKYIVLLEVYNCKNKNK